MDAFEITEALGQIVRDKNVDMELVLDTLEAGFRSAARRKFGSDENIDVVTDPEAGTIEVFALRSVVEEKTDPVTEMTLIEALQIDSDAQLGEQVRVPIPIAEFGRNAIATLKQILVQRVREAEREKVYNDFIGRVGHLVTGTVQQVDRGAVIVNLGNAEAVMPVREQIPHEKFRQGDRMRSVVVKVERTTKGPQIVISRGAPEFLLRLFELEVPEIYERIIEIKAIAREAGDRSKVAVYSTDDRIDPVGACVGIKGARVQNIVRELSNERIDIVPWAAESDQFVMKALSPAPVLRIDSDEERRSMTVVVADDKLSLAIGKAGQNARLAAKLTGWRINIIGESDFEHDRRRAIETQVSVSAVAGIGPTLARKLADAGINNAADVADAGVETLTSVEGIGPAKAESLIVAAREALGRTDDEIAEVGPKDLSELFRELEQEDEYEDDDEESDDVEGETGDADEKD
jgi:N utilization substance protein A